MSLFEVSGFRVEFATPILSAFGSLITIVLALAGSLWLSAVLHVPFVFNGGIGLIAFLFSAMAGWSSAIARLLKPFASLLRDAEARRSFIAVPVETGAYWSTCPFHSRGVIELSRQFRNCFYCASVYIAQEPIYTVYERPVLP